MPRPRSEIAYQVSQGFTFMSKYGTRTFGVGQYVSPDDPIVKTHSHLLEPMSSVVERATAAPGEARPVRPVEESTKAQSGRKGASVPHHLPPEDPDSPASPFAPHQPSAGVVADDVPPEQNLGKGVKADDWKAPTAVKKAEKEADSDK